MKKKPTTMTHTTDNSIIEILNRKKNGIDCTEEESAEIKGWLRDTIILPESNDVPILEKIQLMFPLEYGEWAEEDELKNS